MPTETQTARENRALKTCLANQHERLMFESERFTQLAKDLALHLLLNPQPPDSDKARLAHDHVVRAETYRAAAARINQEF